jgi:hypothetical protein
MCHNVAMHDFIGSYTTPLPEPSARTRTRHTVSQRPSEPASGPDTDTDFGIEVQIQQQPPVSMVAASSDSVPAWILTNLAQTVDRCMRIEPVYHRPRGRGQVPTPTGEYTFNPGAALKALDLLARNMGLFNGKTELMPTLENMSLEDLEDRIQTLVKAHPDLCRLAPGRSVDP